MVLFLWLKDHKEELELLKEKQKKEKEKKKKESRDKAERKNAEKNKSNHVEEMDIAKENNQIETGANNKNSINSKSNNIDSSQEIFNDIFEEDDDRQGQNFTQNKSNNDQGEDKSSNRYYLACFYDDKSKSGNDSDDEMEDLNRPNPKNGGNEKIQNSLIINNKENSKVSVKKN